MPAKEVVRGVCLPVCVCLPSPGKDQNASAHIQRDNLREGPALWCPARAVLCVGRRQKAAAADNGASKACPMIWYDTVTSKYVFPAALHSEDEPSGRVSERLQFSFSRKAWWAKA